MYLAALPMLMSDAGVIENGTPIAADEMRERHAQGDPRAPHLLRRQSAHRTASSSSSRARATTPARRRLAIGWMRRVLTSPDWRAREPAAPARPRRSAPDRAAPARCSAPRRAGSTIRATRGGAQTTDLPAHGSFLTRAHDLHRLRWMLLDPRRREGHRRGRRSSSARSAGAKSLKRARARRARAALARSRRRATAQVRAGRRRGKLSPTRRKPLAIAGGQGSRGAARRSARRLARGGLDATCASRWRPISRSAHRRRSRSSTRCARADHPTAHARGSSRSARRRTTRRSRRMSRRSSRRCRQRRQARAAAPTRRADAVPRRGSRTRDADGEGRRRSSAWSRRRRRAACSSTSRRHVYYTDTSDDAILDYLAVEPLHRARRALHLHEDVGGGARVLERPAPARREGALDVLRRALPAAAADAAVRDRRSSRRRKPDPNIARYAIAKAFDSRVAVGLRGARDGDGGEPRRRPDARGRRRRSAATCSTLAERDGPRDGAVRPHGRRSTARCCRATARSIRTAIVLRDRSRRSSSPRTRTTCTPPSARTRRCTGSTRATSGSRRSCSAKHTARADELDNAVCRNEKRRHVAGAVVTRRAS